MDKTTSELLTLIEASRILKCHPNTLRNMDKDGTFQAIRFGRKKSLRYHKEDILAYLKRHNGHDTQNISRLENEVLTHALRYKAIVESSDDAIISKTLKGVITSWNPAAERLFGYSTSEALGKHINLIIPRELWTEETKIISQLKKGNRIDHFETVRKRKDGSRLMVSLTISLLQDSSGKIIGVSKIARDITEKKKTENELAHLASLVESSTDAIWSRSGDGKIVSWNKGAEKMYGYKASEVLGKSSNMLIPPDKREEMIKAYEAILKGETPERHDNDSERIAKDGHKVAVSASFSPVKDISGKVIAIAIIARDISERKKLEQRKDDFIALASHELKTPLTSLKMFTQVILNRLEKTGDVTSAKLIFKLDKQLNKLSDLVSGLLDISRIQQGKLEYKQEKFYIDELVKESVDNMQQIYPTCQIIIEGKTHRYVIADRNRITQVLTNLISNALKYSPKTSRIIISTQSGRGEVTVGVKDFGMGIPESQQEKIFTRFFQVDNPTYKTYGGLGLGLYISKEIIKRHGGRIWAESQKDKGSTFFFSLPVKNRPIKIPRG